MSRYVSIEFEPEYLNEFHACLRMKNSMAITLYALNLKRSGAPLRSRVIEQSLRALKSLKDELEYFQTKRDRPGSYLVHLLSEISGKSLDEMLVEIENIIRILKEEQKLTEKEYTRLRNLLLSILSASIERSRPLEERILGRIRSSRTYYP